MARIKVLGKSKRNQAKRSAEWSKNLVKGRLAAMSSPSKMRTIRLSKGLTLDDLCLTVGKSAGHIGMYERGTQLLNKDKAEAIAKALGCKTSQLFVISSTNSDKYEVLK